MFGTCAVCNAPRRRDTGDASGSLPTRSLEERQPKEPGSFARRRRLASEPEPASAPHLVARQNPEPGVECRSSLNPPSVDACKKLADSIRGQTLSLPFTTSVDDCDLAVFGHFRDLSASGDKIADRISHDSDLCASAGSDPVVGSQKDTTQELIFVGFTIWFGNLCGRFGFGMANCVP